jgi:hypothetical protein
MVRLPKWLMIVLVLGALIGFVTPALAAEATGKIKSVTADKNEFVFTDKDGKDWTFQMDANAKIQLGTKDIKLNDLKAGDQVTVTYDKQGDKLIAKEVVCKRE